MHEPVPGLYAQLVTEELDRLLRDLEANRVTKDAPDAADAHRAVAEHLRKIVERVLRALPEQERLTRQGELCNALLQWLQRTETDVVTAGDALVVPLEVLREIRDLRRGAALGTSTPQPLVPLTSPDLLVNARGEPVVG